MLPCLPNEIIDTIILEAKDPAIAVIATSSYCVYKLVKYFNEGTYLYIIRHELVGELLWLVKCEFVHPLKLCSKIAFHGSVEFFKRMLPLLVKKSQMEQNNDLFNEIIQAAVKSGSVEKVHFLLAHNVLIKSISDVKYLKRHPIMLTYLANELFDTPDIIFTEDAVVAAIHSDNVTFIRIAERRVNIRNMISYKDIIIAAHIGCFNVLRWYHQACACETSRFASCVSMQFDGRLRLEKLPESYYRLVTPQKYHSYAGNRNIYVISFAEFPELNNPSGTADFSAFDTKELCLDFVDGLPSCRLHILGINYNRLTFADDGQQLEFV